MTRTEERAPDTVATGADAWLEKFGRALAVGLLGSLVVISTHNLFDNLLVHGVGIQLGVLLGLIGGASSR